MTFTTTSLQLDFLTNEIERGTRSGEIKVVSSSWEICLWKMGQVICLMARFILDQRIGSWWNTRRDQLVYLAAVADHRRISAAAPEASISRELDVHLARACIHLVDASARKGPGAIVKGFFIARHWLLSRAQQVVHPKVSRSHPHPVRKKAVQQLLSSPSTSH